MFAYIWLFVGGFERDIIGSLVGNSNDPSEVHSAQFGVMTLMHVEDKIQKVRDLARLSSIAASAFDGNCFKLNNKAGGNAYTVPQIEFLLRIGGLCRITYTLKQFALPANVEAKMRTVTDPDAQHPQATLWQRLEKELNSMLSRLNDACIKAVACGKALSVDSCETKLDMDLMFSRCSLLTQHCTSVVQEWVAIVSGKSFSPLTALLTEKIGAMPLEAIMKIAETTPVDLNALTEHAKHASSKDCYLAYSQFTAANQAYALLCKNLGFAHDSQETEHARDAQRFMSIFHAVKCLTRKLKPTETRPHICSAALSCFVGVPAPLMMSICHRWQTKPSPKENNTRINTYVTL